MHIFLFSFPRFLLTIISSIIHNERLWPRPTEGGRERGDNLARVNIEEQAWNDPRFRLLGEVAGIDRFSALGRCAALWQHCTEAQTYELSAPYIDVISELPGFAEFLVQADLAVRLESGKYRIRGTQGQIEWLGRLRGNAKKAIEQRKSNAASRRAKVAPSDLKTTPSDLDANQDGDLDGSQVGHQEGQQGLHPLSLTLALTPALTQKTKNKERESRFDAEQMEIEAPKAKALGAPGTPPPSLPPLALIWNDKSGALPKVGGVNPSRLAKIKARMRERPDPGYWIGIVERIARSPFCQGDNQRGWRATFDWLLQPETHLKVSEGKYDRLEKGRAGEVVTPERRAFIEAAERAMAESMEEVRRFNQEVREYAADNDI